LRKESFGGDMEVPEAELSGEFETRVPSTRGVHEDYTRGFEAKRRVLRDALRYGQSVPRVPRVEKRDGGGQE
jgi:hypothetical protein